MVVAGCDCSPPIKPVAPSISVDPQKIDFGSVPIGATVEQPVKIENNGRAPLVISSITVADKNDVTIPVNALLVTDCDGNDRMLTGSDVLTIAGGGCARFAVKFAPMSAEMLSTKVIVASSDTKNASVEIPVTGTGVVAPCLKLTPSPTVDFGSVVVGGSKPVQVTMENCGRVPYQLTAIRAKSTGGTATAFTLAQGGTNGVPTLPFQFNPGATRQLQVTYAPTMTSAASSAGDTAVLNVQTSADANESTNLVGHGSAPGCGGMQPTANIVVRNSSGSPINTSTGVDPLTTVTFDGSGSQAPSGARITSYQWSLVSAPPNNSATVGSAAKFPMLLDLAGDYVVSLVVHSADNAGDMCASAPAQATVHVVAPPGVHVELTWAENHGDVDLHYVGPGGKLYEQQGSTPEGDLYWAYSGMSLRGTTSGGGSGSTPPDWGLNNTVYPDSRTNDDASLDVDQLWGKGPENVTHPLPFNGTYEIVVHYFCSHDDSGSDAGAATPTVRVFVNGTQQWSGSGKAMTEGQVWEAANVVVNGSNVTVTPLNKALWDLPATGPNGEFQGCSGGGFPFLRPSRGK